MATTTQNLLADALCAIETGVKKPVQAPRLTYAGARAYLAGGELQSATFTDINGVVRSTSPVRVFDGAPVALLMAAE